MKKKKLLSIFILLLLSATFGCKSKEKRTVEYLFDRYVEAYTKADEKAAKDIFPPYYVEAAGEFLTKKNLTSDLKKYKEQFGEDFNIEYEITGKTKLTDKELKKLNKNITKTFKINYEAKECYKVEGATVFKGEKMVESKTIKNINYCNYKGSWYLVVN